MALISQNVNAKAAAVHEEWLAFQAGTITDTPIAREVAEKSEAAIFGGSQSAEWITYMELFAGDAGDPDREPNLDRLIPRNGDTDTKRKTARAYLIRNGMCSGGTTDRLPNRVGIRLDTP